MYRSEPQTSLGIYFEKKSNLVDFCSPLLRLIKFSASGVQHAVVHLGAVYL